MPTDWLTEWETFRDSALSAWVCKSKRGTEREGVSVRVRERGRERERCKIFWKGMTSALAPFSYLVLYSMCPRAFVTLKKSFIKSASAVFRPSSFKSLSWWPRRSRRSSRRKRRTNTAREILIFPPKVSTTVRQGFNVTKLFTKFGNRLVCLSLTNLYSLV